MTRMRSASSSSSGSSELTTTIASPSAGEREDEVVDLPLGADIDAAGRLVEQQHARLRWRAICRSPPSAGCRRRACRATCSMPLQRIPSARPRLRARPLRLRRSERRSGRAARASGRATLSRIGRLQMQALRLAVLGDEGEPEARVRRAADLNRDRLAIDADFAAAPADGSSRRSSRGFRCARSRAGRRCRGSRRAKLEADAVAALAASRARGAFEREVAHRQHDLASRAARAAGGRRASAADHRRDDAILVSSAIGPVRTCRPSRNTVTRSARCMTSSMRCEM